MRPAGYYAGALAFSAIGGVAGVIGLAHLVDGDMRWAALQAVNVGFCLVMSQRCRRWAEEAET